MKAFGIKDLCIETVDIVPLKLLSPSKTIVIEAISTSFICSEILNQNVSSASLQYEHFKNLHLADYSHENSKHIDILIGIDHYKGLVI